MKQILHSNKVITSSSFSLTPNNSNNNNNNNNNIIIKSSDKKEIITSSAKAWDESFNEICQLSDQNLEKIVDLQLAFYPPNENNNNNNNNNNKRTSSSSSSSISLKNNNNPLFNHNNNSSSSNSNSKTYAMPIPETSTDKKVEFLMRRARMLDEKIKRSEKDHDITKEDIKNINNLYQQLIENTKNDKRIIIQLKDQIHSMKNHIDNTTNINDDKLTKIHSTILNNNNTNKIDDNTIDDIISTRIHHHMDKVVQEVAKTCASEQALFLSKWAERVNYENNNSNNHGLEKELTRLQADHNRLKSRYDSLEIICSDLRNTLATRDYESQELQRKALSSLRLEMQSSFDSLMRKLNDNLITVPKFESMFNDLQQKLEIQQKHNEQCIQKQLVRIFKLEENNNEFHKLIEEQVQKLQLLHEYSSNIAIRITELDEHTTKDLESSFQMSETLKSQIDEALKKSHNDLKEHVNTVTLSFESLQHNVKSLFNQQQERVDDNFEAFSRNLNDFEKDMMKRSVTHDDLEKQLLSVKEKIESYKKDTESINATSKQKIEVIIILILILY